MNVRASPVRMVAGVKTAGHPTSATVLKQTWVNFPGEEITVMSDSMAVWTMNARMEPPAIHGWRVENTATRACALTASMMSGVPQGRPSLSPPRDSFTFRWFWKKGVEGRLSTMFTKVSGCSFASAPLYPICCSSIGGIQTPTSCWR